MLRLGIIFGQWLSLCLRIHVYLHLFPMVLPELTLTQVLFNTIFNRNEIAQSWRTASTPGQKCPNFCSVYLGICSLIPAQSSALTWLQCFPISRKVKLFFLKPRSPKVSPGSFISSSWNTAKSLLLSTPFINTIRLPGKQGRSKALKKYLQQHERAGSTFPSKNPAQRMIQHLFNMG